MKNYRIGVDIGGTSFKYGIVDEEGQDIERQAVKNDILGSLKAYDNDQLKIMDQVCKLLVEGKPSEDYDEEE